MAQQPAVELVGFGECSAVLACHSDKQDAEMLHAADQAAMEEQPADQPLGFGECSAGRP